MAEAGGWRVQDQPGLHGETVKKKKKTIIKNIFIN
jgi:hypothetical protein